METYSFSKTAAQLPSWLSCEVEAMDQRTDKMNPYPFAHPDDLSDYVTFHQNDYMRLSEREEVKAAKTESIVLNGNAFLASTLYGGGAANQDHDNFRRRLSQSMQSEDAILTSSGWTANVGLLEAIARPNTPIYLDQKAHASLWDGARLSQGRSIMVRHNDPEAMERRIQRDGAGIIVIDSVYSTTGAIADLPAYVAIAERTGCVLVVDEAHGFGMFGEGLGGLAVAQGVADRIHFRTVSFSKALGGHGGCIAASRHLIWFLTHRARSVIFSSSALPCDSAAHLKALEIAMAEPQLAHHAQNMAALLRQMLQERNVTLCGSASQIVSVEIPTEAMACRMYGHLREHGVLCSVFLAPAVPLGTGLLRFSVHSRTNEAEILRTANALEVALQREGLLASYRQAA